jgi:large subunit ribosomal protein L21
LPEIWVHAFKVDAMFAVFEDGGRQFRVKSGDVLAVDYRNDVQDGQAITFDKILLANGGGPSIVGQPVISGATVTAEVVTAQLKGLKLEIQTFHRRNASKRHTGHRQKYTRVKITGITVPNLTVVERPVAPATT